jgi:hypothetical protein
VCRARTKAGTFRILPGLAATRAGEEARRILAMVLVMYAGAAPRTVPDCTPWKGQATAFAKGHSRTTSRSPRRMPLGWTTMGSRTMKRRLRENALGARQDGSQG